jgi:hypothetical protein
MSYMQDVPVKNRDLLKRLNRYRDFLMNDIESFQKNFHLSCQQDARNRHYWVGEKYLKEILDQGEGHEGFPDSLVGYELSVHRKDHEFYSRDAHPSFRKDSTAHLSWMNQELISWLGVKHNALTAWYPPGGYISWHNNANAPAYNLIFTWSETGDGQFRYLDPVSKEIVTMKDHKGWQCKAAYFGHYDEPERLFYHSASADCWRCTVSFTFDTSDLSAMIREDLLEEISSEE